MFDRQALINTLTSNRFQKVNTMHLYYNQNYRNDTNINDMQLLIFKNLNQLIYKHHSISWKT